MKRVLLVEDEVMVRNSLKLLLSSRGHIVATAGTVAEGIECLALGPSHVLLDINLPDGLGTTIARRIRQHKMPILIAVLSACQDADVLAEIQTLALDAIFAKPTDWNVIVQWIG